MCLAPIQYHLARLGKHPFAATRTLDQVKLHAARGADIARGQTRIECRLETVAQIDVIGIAWVHAIWHRFAVRRARAIFPGDLRTRAADSRSAASSPDISRNPWSTAVARPGLARESISHPCELLWRGLLHERIVTEA